MFRQYVLNLLTQTSTWIGLIMILEALFLPRTVLIFTAILFILHDDLKLQGFFAKIREAIEKRWAQ